MLDYPLNGASVVFLAGCVYIGCQIIAHSDAFAAITTLGRSGNRKYRDADEREFRNPSLGYYI